MCGRFNVTSDPVGQLILEITGRGFDVDTRYNIAPTEAVPVIVHDDHGNNDGGWAVRDMRWWLVPYWSDGPSTRYAMFNAKAETIDTSRAFREPFKRRRCIVPASNYYEWRKEAGGKVPFMIGPESGDALAFAGVWDRWRRDDEVIESCTIITTDAPGDMKSIHHRMPVHLTRAQVQEWINAETSPERLKELLAPEIRTRLAVTPVSTYVNNARNKDERCIEPIGDASIIH